MQYRIGFFAEKSPRSAAARGYQQVIWTGSGGSDRSGSDGSADPAGICSGSAGSGCSAGSDYSET